MKITMACPTVWLLCGGWGAWRKCARANACVFCVCVCVFPASSELTLEEVTVDLETALTLAAQAGLVENVKTLLQHGASPHSTNSNNESPLLLGNTHSHTQLTQLCICTYCTVVLHTVPCCTRVLKKLNVVPTYTSYIEEYNPT